ncbi:protein of unknown function [uncultured Sphingopyxis sp.]|uniref:Uncharacterized protein n=1 Tax=uncultured Sphingopyxis sp. TaxID=310581 RepID=A0A1Y5PRI7_9SPHN|nr:protein of unknown function [uncultured Sphingopyxis sp.]
MSWFPLPQAGGAAKLANLFASCSGVGNRDVAAHPRPLPQAGGETMPASGSNSDTDLRPK